MINKIIKIKGVGKYLNTNPNSDANFKQANIVYAPNGSGKTTLTSIFRSLSQNDEKLIENRRSFDYQEPQEIQMLIDSTHFKYTQLKKWTNNGYGNIEIFDTFFVNDNVFSGFDVSTDNRKNLHKFLLSKEIIDLDNNISQIKNQISSLSNNLSELTNKLNLVRGSITLDTYLKLQGNEIELLTQKKALENYIEQFRNKESIRKTEELRSVKLFDYNIDVERLKIILSINIDNISSEYSTFISLFENRKKLLEKHFGNKSESWLLQGFKAVNSEGYDCGCPFCSNTEYKSNQIVIAYGQFFNESYNSIKNEISQFLKAFTGINVDTFEAQCQINIDVNKANFPFWNKYLFELSNPELKIKEEYKKLKECIDLTIGTLQKKMSSPLESINSSIVNEFILSINTITAKIIQYNSDILENNKLILELKKEKHNIGELTSNHKRILSIIERTTNDTIINQCKDYETKTILKKGLEEEKVKRQNELKIKTVELFKKYSKHMNAYLSTFNTPIRIKEIKSQAYSSPDNFADYTFTLGINDIKANLVKHTLSEGDKSSIAFSFFLAKLTEDSDLSNKIIVIDDPLSSLDSNRRQRTIEAIEKISKKAKQIFLLSHDEMLLFDVYERGKMVEMQALQINSQVNICFWDIEQAMMHPYFKVIKELSDFNETNDLSSDLDNMRSKIRRAIEGTLKFRYFKFLDEVTLLPNGKSIQKFDRKFGLGKMIDKLEFSNCNFKINKKEDVINRLRELNEYSNPPNHDNSDIAHRQASTNKEELKGFIRDTLELIHEML